MKNFLILTLLGMFATVAMAGDEGCSWQKAYPPAKAGMVRHVLHLPELADESAVQIELIAGKTIETDGVNFYGFGGGIEEKEIQGWAYPSYEVTVGPLNSTLIGVRGKPSKVQKFVCIGDGPPYMVRYNSKLPVVVYAPEGVEVRHRLWKVASEQKAIGKQ